MFTVPVIIVIAVVIVIIMLVKHSPLSEFNFFQTVGFNQFY